MVHWPHVDSNPIESNRIEVSSWRAGARGAKRSERLGISCLLPLRDLSEDYRVYRRDLLIVCEFASTSRSMPMPRAFKEQTSAPRCILCLTHALSALLVSACLQLQFYLKAQYRIGSDCALLVGLDMYSIHVLHGYGSNIHIPTTRMCI